MSYIANFVFQPTTKMFDQGEIRRIRRKKNQPATCTLNYVSQPFRIVKFCIIHLWSKGYFCSTVGVVAEEIVKKYIDNQKDEDATFKVWEKKGFILSRRTFMYLAFFVL
jgi:hypothetical protein